MNKRCEPNLIKENIKDANKHTKNVQHLYVIANYNKEIPLHTY